MRVLFLGTWSHGGFGKVTVELGKRFIAAGADVRVLAVDHRGQPVTGPLAGRVWPASMLEGSHGVRTFAAIDGSFWRKLDARDQWTPDVVFAIEDVTGLAARMSQASREVWDAVPIFHYCPIEGDNLPVSWAGIWSLARPVAMSEYGRRVMSEYLGRDVPMVYHGVDTEVFRPVSLNDPIILDGKRLGTKEACKQYFGLDPNRLLILRSDAPVARKFYDAFVRAMVPVIEARDDVDVLIHASATGQGVDIFAELHRYQSAIEGRIHVTGMHDTYQGLTNEGVAALMNAADLYVSTTGGEGFGLNLAESLACGVPVVVNDWAADAEVVGPGGILVPPLSDSYGEVVRFHSEYGMDWAVPDARAFAEPILRLLDKPSLRRSIGAEGRRHVLRAFSWDHAATTFLTMFEEADADHSDSLGHEDEAGPDDVGRRLVANGVAG